MNFGIGRQVAESDGVEASGIAMAASRSGVRHVASVPSVRCVCVCVPHCHHQSI